MNSDIRLLTKEEYDTLPEDYKQAITSEFAIALGERYFAEKVAQVQFEGVIKSGFIGTYWIDSIRDKKSEYHSLTQLSSNPYFKSDIGLRLITDIPNDAEIKIDKDGNKIIYYGTYPSTIVEPNESSMIDTSKQVDEITVYIDGEEISLPVYESNGKYYVAMKGIHSYKGSDIKLKNDEVINGNTTDTIFFEMKPLMWLGLNNGKMINSEVVLAGVPFTKDRTTRVSSYDETLIKKFIDECFQKIFLKFNYLMKKKQKLLMKFFMIMI